MTVSGFNAFQRRHTMVQHFSPRCCEEENRVAVWVHCEEERMLAVWVEDSGFRWTYNSNTRVRVSRSDDTDLDSTAQVPGQSPELTAWLTKNLGHPTGEVLTLHRYGAALSWTTVMKRPPRSHLWG
ncbi:hypothetical protein Taro_043549 [Colocasia esculenta]|uniref:Uncharacterized protein n=1 Tax=Colocasia esculenta TaxID=4460 RepID=A0A843WJQ1_COLES|nr:hypothetical protein [Colocasia esculenta]